jgi:hypothetical protein
VSDQTKPTPNAKPEPTPTAEINPALAASNAAVAADAKSLGDDDDLEVNDQPAKRGGIMSARRFAKQGEHQTLADPNLAKPNNPCFDFDAKSEPILAAGEKILADVTRDGIRVVVTNHGRKIFCCSLDQFEAKHGKLPNRPLFEKYFPNAVK